MMEFLILCFIIIIFALLCKVFTLLFNLLLRFAIFLFIPLMCWMLIFIFIASIFCSLPPDGWGNFQPGKWNLLSMQISDSPARGRVPSRSVLACGVSK